MSEAAVHFRKVADELKASGALDPKVLNVDTNTLLYQVPGGMLSNLISQLKQAGKEDKYYDVLAEIPRVREDFGYPPLVTPSSQIVGTQAVLNIITGERYKMVPKESKAMLRGEYGKLPGTVNEEVRAKAGIKPRGRHHLPPRRPSGARASQVPRGVQGPRQERGGRALPRAVPAGRTQVHQPPQPAHAEAAPHDGSHRAPRSEGARRRALLPQVKRNEKSPFHLEGRFSYFVRSSCICTCGMPSSKNSSDVW